MNSDKHKDVIRSILRSALDAQPPAEGPHVVEDENLLACLEENLLTPDERRKIVEHLAACPRCRSELAELVQANVIGASAIAASPRKTRPIALKAAVFVLAAAVFLCIVGIPLIERLVRGPESQIAQLQENVRQGRYAKVLEDAGALLKQELSEDQRTQAERLRDEAGYHVALSELGKGNWDRVKQLQSSLPQPTGGGSRILNLRLQAEREIPDESTLNYKGSLLDHGFKPIGRSKALPPETEAITSLSNDFAKAVTENPENVSLRLNYGELLWERRLSGPAKVQFEEVLRLEPDNLEARLGLGLVAFTDRSYEQALRRFGEVLDRDEDLLAAHVNAALCLERLARPEEATRHWQYVRDHTEDASLRQSVDKHLARDL
jgi:hypothetical protein